MKNRSEISRIYNQYFYDRLHGVVDKIDWNQHTLEEKNIFLSVAQDYSETMRQDAFQAEAKNDALSHASYLKYFEIHETFVTQLKEAGAQRAPIQSSLFSSNNNSENHSPRPPSP